MWLKKNIILILKYSPFQVWLLFDVFAKKYLTSYMSHERTRHSCCSYSFLGQKKKKNLKAYLPLRYYLQEDATVLQFGFLY